MVNRHLQLSEKIHYNIYLTSEARIDDELAMVYLQVLHVSGTMHVSLNMHGSCMQHAHYMQEISTRIMI